MIKGEMMDNQPSQIQTNDKADERKLLEELVILQKQQNTDMAEIKKHTGCMYTYLIISVILGALYIFYILFLRF